MAIDADWVVPFVVQLIGEYVLPILTMSETDWQAIRSKTTQNFVLENSAFLALTASRVRSYWHCYHRYVFPTWETYPGRRVIETLRDG